MAELWNYFEPVKGDPFYLTCTICQSKFKGWKRSKLEEHLVTKHQLKVLPKPPQLETNPPKPAMPNIIGDEEIFLNGLLSSLDQNQPLFNREECLTIPSRKPQIEKVILTRSKKRRLTFNQIQIDMLTRLPHIGAKIFDSLDNLSLLKCKEVSRTWYDFMDDQKFPWVRMIKTYIKESNKMYTECPKHWHKLFRKIKTLHVKKFACEIQKDIALKIRLDCTSTSHVGKGLTPLHFAIMFSNDIDYETIKNIFEAEIVKNPRDKDGDTPLHIAAGESNLKVFQLIKEKVDDINPKNNYEDTPLHKAASSDRISDLGAKKIAELIVENVTDKNPANKFGTTPLHNAALKGRLDMFQLIFEVAMNKNPIDHFGNTPFHNAAGGGGKGFKSCQYYSMNRTCHHHTICQMIFDNVENKNPENFVGKTPLQMANESNHSLVVNVLTPKEVKKRKLNINKSSSKAKRLKCK